jgi:hypothetical protein
MDERMARAEKLAAMRERDGQGPRQMRMMEQLTELGSVLERLEERLQPALRSPGPTAALHAELPPAESSLAQFMQDATAHLQQLVMRAADLADRVDL